MPEKPNQFGKSTLLNIARLLVFSLVVWMIYRTIIASQQDFSEYELSFRDLSFQWLSIAAISYSLGLTCFACFWHGTLRILGQQPSRTESLGSYWLSQLGKYVPGKALVIIIRSERVCSVHTKRNPAVAAVFIETLGMMAVGAVISGLLLAIFYDRHQDNYLLYLNVGLAIAAGIPAMPPLFRKVISILSKRKSKGSLVVDIESLTLKTIWPFWLLSAVGWVFLGFSLHAVLYAIPSEHSVSQLGWSDFPIILSTVALAMVAGFVSLLPGGAGIREYVILTLLTPIVGVALAAASAVILRLIWLFVELFFASLFFILMRRNPRSALE